MVGVVIETVPNVAAAPAFFADGFAEPESILTPECCCQSRTVVSETRDENRGDVPVTVTVPLPSIW